MRAKSHNLINFFKVHGGIVRFSTMLKAGFHPDTLAAFERQKKIEKIGRGLYRMTDYVADSHPDLLTACLQAPKAIVCLISALSFHEATNEIPRVVDLAIVRGGRANEINYPPAKFYRFAYNTWKIGIEDHKIGKHQIRVYGLAKTVTDCFKFRNRIGMDIAREALKTAVLEKRTPPQEIMRYAKICRVSNIIKPILESIT